MWPWPTHYHVPCRVTLWVGSAAAQVYRHVRPAVKGCALHVLVCLVLSRNKLSTGNVANSWCVLGAGDNAPETNICVFTLKRG